MIKTHDQVRQDYPARTDPVSMTKQSFTDACDINLIVSRHASSGLWDHLNPTAPTFGDASMSVELQEAMTIVDQAGASFDELPALVRAASNNNPVQFLEMLSQPDSFAHLVEQGLPTDFVPEPPAGPPAEPVPEPEPSAPPSPAP